ncbi:MAG: hypothetical protein KIT25_06460 [Enhydrobacter sp.]|nr:MAG: hypothetical protein KIT25_06460 [Enhydrobacter sp.]
MDQAALETAKLLGAGSAQIVLAAGLVFFAGCTVGLARLLFREIKSCGEERTQVIHQNIEASNKVAAAIDGNTQVMKAALDALKSR